MVRMRPRREETEKMYEDFDKNLLCQDRRLSHYLVPALVPACFTIAVPSLLYCTIFAYNVLDIFSHPFY
jgi:hypothetical protein